MSITTQDKTLRVRRVVQMHHTEEQPLVEIIEMRFEHSSMDQVTKQQSVHDVYDKENTASNNIDLWHGKCMKSVQAGHHEPRRGQPSVASLHGEARHSQVQRRQGVARARLSQHACRAWRQRTFSVEWL